MPAEPTSASTNPAAAAAAATTPTSGRLRILALDGGGIKGAYTASVLATLEQRTGKAVIDHFDLIAGTSTGGILAIGLSVGLTAERMREFYREKGSVIFPISGLVTRSRRMVWQLSGPKHDAAVLRKVLQSVLGTLTIGDARTRLVIPAYDVTEGRVYLFKTAHHQALAFDTKIPLVDVALATAAAPTFFAAADVQNGGTASYVDGGVWANSPAMVALIEATHFLHHPATEIDVLSIGTTSQLLSVSKKRRTGGVVRWAPGLVELLMTGQVQAVTAQAQLLTGGGVHRINHQTVRGRFGLDKSETVGELIQLGHSDAAKRVNYDVAQTKFFNGVPVRPFVPFG